MNSPLYAWGFLAVAVAFNVLGNLLLKKAGLAKGSPGVDVFLSGTFIIGGLFFVLNLLAYTLSQTQLPISIAYPVLVGASMIGIALGARFYFNESIGLLQVVGMLVIVAGVGLVAAAKPPV